MAFFEGILYTYSWPLFHAVNPFFIWIDSWNVHKKLVDFCKNWRKVFQSSRVLLQAIWCLKSRNATIFRQALKWNFIHLSLKNCTTIQNVSHYSRTSGEMDRIPLISYDHLWSTLKLLVFCNDVSHFPIYLYLKNNANRCIPQLVTSLQVT